MKSQDYKNQFITHFTDKYSYIDSARIALEGGCRWIQLRMKDTEENIFEETALTVQRMCREYGATFIIDDLGKNDMPIAQAREMLGEGFIIGGTVNSFDDVLYHLQSAAPDYFGCGPFRYTSTKKNLAPILGFEGYRELTGRMKRAQINIPTVAIGGIGKEDIPGLLETGIQGIAMSGSVLKADDPIKEMNEITRIIKNYQQTLKF